MGHEPCKKSLNVLGQVFGDIHAIACGEEMVYNTFGNSDDELDDNVLLGQWAAITEDEELLNLLPGNFSFYGLFRCVSSCSCFTTQFKYGLILNAVHVTCE